MPSITRLLSAAVLLSLLAGCDSSSSPAQPESAGTTATSGSSVQATRCDGLRKQGKSLALQQLGLETLKSESDQIFSHFLAPDYLKVKELASQISTPGISQSTYKSDFDQITRITQTATQAAGLNPTALQGVQGTQRLLNLTPGDFDAEGGFSLGSSSVSQAEEENLKVGDISSAFLKIDESSDSSTFIYEVDLRQVTEAGQIDSAQSINLFDYVESLLPPDCVNVSSLLDLNGFNTLPVDPIAVSE